MSWLMKLLGLSRHEPTPEIKAGQEAAKAATSAIEGAKEAANSYWDARQRNVARDDAGMTDDYQRAERERIRR